MCIYMHHPKGANDGEPISLKHWRSMVSEIGGGGAGIMWPHNGVAVKVKRSSYRCEDHIYQAYARLVKAGIPCVAHIRGTHGTIANVQPFVAWKGMLGYALVHSIPELAYGKMNDNRIEPHSDASALGPALLDILDVPNIHDERLTQLLRQLILKEEDDAQIILMDATGDIEHIGSYMSQWHDIGFSDYVPEFFY